MLSRCSQSIVKIIYYLRYFPRLGCIECVLVFIFTGIKTSFLTHLLIIQLLIFLHFYSLKVHDIIDFSCENNLCFKDDSGSKMYAEKT